MRSKAVTTICVIALVLGALGGFSFLGGCVMLVAQPAIEEAVNAFQRSLPTPPGQLDLQIQMQHEMAAMQRAHRPWMVASMCALLGAVVVLMVGSLQGLKRTPSGRKWLMAAMIVALSADLFRLYPAHRMQQDTQVITQRHMQRIMQTMPNPAAARAASGVTQFSMQIGTATGLLLIFGWATLKAGFYAWSLWYLTRAGTKREFGLAKTAAAPCAAG